MSSLIVHVDPLGRRLRFADASHNSSAELLVQLTTRQGASVHTGLSVEDAEAVHAALGEWIEAHR